MNLAHRRNHRSSLCLVVVGSLRLWAAACAPGAPAIPPDNGGADSGNVFANALISVELSGSLTTCATMLPGCAQGTPQPAPCGENPALGAPDGIAQTLAPGDVLQVGFLCSSFIVAHPDAGDLEIYGDTDAGTAVVEASQDGSTFLTLGILSTAPQTFSLSAAPLSEASFVRITASGPGPVSIDAVQAL